MPLDTFPLAHGWQLKQRNQNHALADDFADSEGWIAATVPGSVHQDLLGANAIPDPFIGTNERAVQWVGEADWLYRCRFDVAAALLAHPALALCFDGLDTFATVWLNGQHILTSDNMFIPQRIAVDGVLRAGENELRILFESALRLGKQREQEGGVRRLWNGDSSRLYVRKAQYHYGWDWGPTLLTAGPWREIRLEAYGARIAEVYCPVELAPDLNRATLPVQITSEGNAALAEITLLDPEGAPIMGATVRSTMATRPIDSRSTGRACGGQMATARSRCIALSLRCTTHRAQRSTSTSSRSGCDGCDSSRSQSTAKMAAVSISKSTTRRSSLAAQTGFPPTRLRLGSRLRTTAHC